MARSHDEHYYANPPQLIDGLIRSPRIDLRNETLALRHVNAVLLADFVRGWAQSHGQALQKIGQILPETQAAEVPADAFLDRVPELLAGNTRTLSCFGPGAPRIQPCVI